MRTRVPMDADWHVNRYLLDIRGIYHENNSQHVKSMTQYQLRFISPFGRD